MLYLFQAVKYLLRFYLKTFAIIFEVEIINKVLDISCINHAAF